MTTTLQPVIEKSETYTSSFSKRSLPTIGSKRVPLGLSIALSQFSFVGSRFFSLVEKYAESSTLVVRDGYFDGEVGD